MAVKGNTRTIALLLVAITGCGGVSEDRAANQRVNTGGATADGGNPGSSGGNGAASTGGGDATGGHRASGGSSTGNGGSSGNAGAGVAGKPSSGGSATAGAPGVVDGGSGVMDGSAGASSFSGCRAPFEPGCSSCCVQGQGYCTQLSASGGDWYNASSALGTVCPRECPRCASCSRNDEEQSRNLVCRAECDCTLDPGIDPCFSSGCACYCVRRAHLREVCPELDVCP